MSQSVAVTSLYHVQSKVVLYLYIHLLTHCREAIGRSADATSKGVYAKSRLALAFADPRDRQGILYWLLCLFCRATRQPRPQTFLAGGQARWHTQNTRRWNRFWRDDRSSSAISRLPECVASVRSARPVFGATSVSSVGASVCLTQRESRT